jgi:hypothetical protein
MDYWIQMDGNILVSLSSIWDAISFCDKEGVSCFAPRKYIDKLIASYECISGLRPKTKKIASPLVKRDHPDIYDSAFLEEVGIQQYQLLSGQLQWAILLGRFNIVVAIMTMSAFRSAPKKGYLNQIKQICVYLSKMKHSVIRFHTEEPDCSDIPRTQYQCKLSVYRGARESSRRMQMDGDVSIPLAKRAKKILRVENQSKLPSNKTCKKYM